ncbi:MAG: PLDc N-terminal domain-containing protein [Cyclobacteriaceae bacterium]|nr:PLDc N-terminal domain-containing protein [Cyclobacteriaceae bacterium]MDX5467895.1 PLDc N-terminal domain-containing protein [Cyclobacteriaceae bacterium]
MLKVLGILIYAYTIYDVVTSRFANSNDKLIWILIVLLLPILGTILWFAMGRNKRI